VFSTKHRNAVGYRPVTGPIGCMLPHSVFDIGLIRLNDYISVFILRRNSFHHSEKNVKHGYT